MQIKLNARLSAYAKVDGSTCDHPDISTVTNDQIDQLFKEEDKPEAVTKTEIDMLFEHETVSYSEIDSLFKR